MTPPPSRGAVRWLAVAVLLALAPFAAAQPLDTNLLDNPGFEDGTTGWTVAGCEVVTYGSDGVAGSDVADVIDGGGQLLRSTAAGSASQVIALTSVPEGAHLHVGGFFGGNDDWPDEAHLELRFFDGGLDPTDTVVLPAVTDENRNFETVLLRRAALVEIPAGSTSVELVVQLTDLLCCSEFGVADELFAELVLTPLTPDPLPSDTELLVNGDFESGWTTGSPLQPAAAQAWEGKTRDEDQGVGATGAVAVRGYEDGDSPDLVPDTDISCLITGGEPGTSCLPGNAGNLLAGDEGGGVLSQQLDARGNLAAGDFSGADALALRVSAFLGAAESWPDHATVRVRFLDDTASEISGDAAVGPVTFYERNEQTLLLKREAELTIPAGTAFIDVDIELDDLLCCSERQLVDNVSAMLVTPVGPPVHAFGANLLVNPSFEAGFAEGSPNGSPLVLTDANGWRGADRDPDPEEVLSGTVRVVGYGVDPDLTDPELLDLAEAKELGGLLLRGEQGDATLVQCLDLRGHAEQVAKGLLEVEAQAWLGGIGQFLDTATLRLRFLDQTGGQLGLAATLGPVTRDDREGLTTLLKRKGTYDVPAGTVEIEVALLFEDEQCCSEWALADGLDVRLALKDVRACDAGRLKAAGGLYKSALTCHSKAAAKDTSGGAVLAACLDKAAAKFEKTFDKLAAKAAKKGQACSYQDATEDVTSDVLGDAQSLADGVTDGMDGADTGDRALRAKLLKLAGGLGKGLAAASAKDIKKPDPAKLAAKQTKLAAKFIAKVEAAVAKAAAAGVSYDGPAAGSLANDVQAGIDALVETLH